MLRSASRVSATSAHSWAWIASSDSFSTQFDRGVQPDRADDVRRSRFEPRRRIEEGRLLERDLLDHRPAALPRRHCCEQLGAAPQAADAGRPVELVRGEGVEVGADRRRRSTRQTRHRLAAVEQQQRAFECAISAARFASRIEPSTLDTCAKATTRCSSVSIASAASRSIWPSGVSGTASTS